MVFVCFLVIFITIIIKTITIFITEIIIFIIKIYLNLILQYALLCRFGGRKKDHIACLGEGVSELNGQCPLKIIFFRLDVVLKPKFLAIGKRNFSRFAFR